MSSSEIEEFWPSTELYPSSRAWHDGSAGRMHYFQEDAPDEVVRAITARFG